jgi:hypothetical protein
MDEKFKHLTTNGYQFEMGKYISDGWKLFSKGAGSFIGFTVLYFIIIFIVNLLPFVSIVSGFLQTILLAGYVLFCRNLLSNREEFGNFFGGFNQASNLVIYTLLMILVVLPLLIVLFTALIPFELLPTLFSGDPSEIREFGERIFFYLTARLPIFFIIFCGFIYITVSYSFAPALIVDAGLSPWTAMETSRRVIGKQFFPFLGMMIILGLLLSIGSLITCLLGALVAIPYYYCVIFCAYDDILKPHADTVVDQIDQFGEQQRDINTETQEN